MKIESKINIHNNFDILVRDVKTGEEKWYKAYNIVLNQGLTRFADGQTWGTNIYFGDGTGTLDVTRTALFNSLGSKSTSLDGQGNDGNGVFWQRRKSAPILPAEQIGAYFREIGLGSPMVTHAFIEDSEGNPITLGPKTDSEEIIFYATVFMVVEDWNTLSWLSMPDTSNWPNAVFGFPANPNAEYVTARKSLDSAFIGTVHPQGETWVATPSYANIGDFKRRGTLPKRETGDLNRKYGVQALYLHHAASGNPYLRVDFNTMPSAFWDGRIFTDEQMGEGDGEKTGFSFNWFLSQDETIKVNGVTKVEGTDYETFAFPYDFVIDYMGIKPWVGQIVEVSNGTVTNKDNALNGGITTGLSAARLGTDGGEVIIDLGDSLKWGIGELGAAQVYTYENSLLQYSAWVSNDNESWTQVAEDVEHPQMGSNGVYYSAWDTVPDFEFRYVKIRRTATVGNGAVGEFYFKVKKHSIEFVSPVPAGHAVVGDYKVKYIPKDSEHTLEGSFVFQFGHQNPT